MLLCLDVGNTHIFGGVWQDNRISLRFRFNSRRGDSSDQIGIFLKNVLRENDISLKEISEIAICSVVPHMDYSVSHACRKYFNIDPFILQAGVKTGLKINYRNPTEVGSDRIANAIGAMHMLPKQALIVVDFGTATTLCTISADRQYLGGVIIPGMKLSIDALQTQAAKLPSVEIIKPECIIGRSTVESMQAGLFYSQAATIEHMTQRICDDVLSCSRDAVKVVGTGGFVYLFGELGIFDIMEPDLVLHGLQVAQRLNSKSGVHVIPR